MNAYFTSGRAIDVILAIVLVEAVALLAWRRRTGLGLADVVGQLLSGVLLLAAVRCALTGADVRWTGLFLSASLPAHLFDLSRRVSGRMGSVAGKTNAARDR